MKMMIGIASAQTYMGDRLILCVGRVSSTVANLHNQLNLTSINCIISREESGDYFRVSSRQEGKS